MATPNSNKNPQAQTPKVQPKKKPRRDMRKEDYNPKYKEHCESHDPWERLPYETPRQFDYFNMFKDMDGSERSLVAVAKRLKQHVSGLRQRAAYHFWAERAAAWDDYKAKVANRAKLKSIEQMHGAHASSSKAIQTVLLAPIKSAVKRITMAEREGKDLFGKSNIKELFKTCLNAARTFPEVAKLERLSRGEPNEIVNHDLTSGGVAAAATTIQINVQGSQSPLLNKLQEAIENEVPEKE